MSEGATTQAEPQRDQYGRFKLLTLPLELTAKDFAPWPQETRTLLDMFLDRGAAADASFSVIDASRVQVHKTALRNGSTIVLCGTPAFDWEMGDWIQINGQRFLAGGTWKWASDRMFEASAAVDVSDVARWMATATARVTRVDPATRMIIVGEMIEHRLITPREFRSVLPPGRRSRVPAHVQQNRPRLDGRKRR